MVFIKNKFYVSVSLRSNFPNLEAKTKIKNQLISQMDFRRLFDIFPYQLEKFPQKAALVKKQDLGWETYSTAECVAEINRVSAGLLDLGLKRGDKVAIMSGIGSPKWNFLDFGIQQVGGITVPLHANARPTQIEHVLNDAEVKFCIVANKELYEKVNAVRANVISLRKIFTFKKLPNIPFWEDLVTEPTSSHLAEFEGRKASIHEDDLATIIYTSGTTGNPKGVMLSHKNIVSNIKATISLVPINCDKKTLSFLPLSHVFERMVTYTYMAVGASVHYAERVDTVLENLKEIRPHYFSSVPRLLERIYDSILEIGNEKGGLTKKILYWAVRLGERYNGERKVGLFYFIKLQLANLLVYRKWRKALGGRVEGVMVGAAALQPKLGRLFSAAGVEIREGYGMTETSPVISFNRFEPGGVRFGTVGMAIPGVEIKIDTPIINREAEILVKGPNVMLGYYNLPEETDKHFDEEGWFRTGDVGKIVDKRFLQITGRQKDIFKTSSGKYVAPALLETELNSSIYIDNSIVLGFQRPFVTALVIPNFVNLKRWCEENNVHWTSPQYMVINPKVVEFMESVIEEINEDMSNVERIRKHHLLFESWEVETEELTYTLKLRRPFILEKYKKEIEAMYS